MSAFADYNFSGKHNLILKGEIGDLEVELCIPEQPKFDVCAIIGHPHSLYGGTMYNKVVTSMASGFAKVNIPSIKFNFRGVGKSFGEYDAGIGESADMLIIAKLWQQMHPRCKIIFTGFSFGSYVAYRAAANLPKQDLLSLITVAPSVENYDYKEFLHFTAPWLVIQGDKDEIVNPESVYKFVKNFTPPLKIIIFPETTHFFHGKLIELKAKLIEYLAEIITKS